WICKRTPAAVNESQECLGGNGYIEESILPRLYRQAPLNSIWEGSGNVQCLDVLRAMRRAPGTVDALLDELDAASGGHRAYDRRVDALRGLLERRDGLERSARRLVEEMALALQASVLIRSGNNAVSDAFCEARLAGDAGLAFGTRPASTDCAAIIDRGRPRVD